MIQRVCYLGSAGDSTVIGSDDVLGIAFKLIQHSRHLANCDGDRGAPAIVTDHDFARGARCARSGEHTGLGDGTYIIGDAPLEQLIGFIKNAGFGISVEIQIDGFTWVHRKGGYILPIAAHQHAIRLGIDGDLSRYGCGCGMIQRNEIFPCRIWRSEYIAADGLVAGRGDSEAGTIGRDGVIMLVEGVGA